MNRTERLYALVEELRAVAPRSRTVGWLAGRFEVSTRTVHRWYLDAWCRLRQDRRAFRTDRIATASLTAEAAPDRDLGSIGPDDVATVGLASILE